MIVCNIVDADGILSNFLIKLIHRIQRALRMNAPGAVCYWDSEAVMDGDVTFDSNSAISEGGKHSRDRRFVWSTSAIGYGLGRE